MTVDAFVLAGGAGRRMGFDKARASVDGWPIAVRVGLALREVADRVVLVRRGAWDGLPWVWPDGTSIEVVREPSVGKRHPLWGVGMALSSARTRHVLVAPCDVPDVPVDLLRALARAGPAVASDPGGLHPLIGVFPAADASRARDLARAGRPVRAFVESYAIVRVDAPLSNVNRPGDGIDRLEDIAPRFAPLKGENLARALEAEVTRRLTTRGARIPWAALERLPTP